ncbi:ZIP family metal transporter [Zhouia sp. PK063]|uniref:ZIP family metal transporter n=1 Tax=Zhouia sp. PK063 TaxID=3373602 RepID=UPI00379F3441
MDIIIQIILFAGFSGMTIIIGAVLANTFEHHIKESKLKDTIVHTMISFGGGIILSAVALVLIPNSMHELTLWPMVFTFGLGAFLFAILDKILSENGSKTATLLAMMMDFVPEAIVLGAVFANDKPTAALLAIFIGLQNLPEAFNAFRDLVWSGFNTQTSISIFFGLSFSGIICALFGYLFLQGATHATAYIMMFSAGGILYLLFQDIVPNGKLNNTWLPSLGATLGFIIGLVGEQLL